MHPVATDGNLRPPGNRIKKLWIPVFAGMAGAFDYGVAIFCGRRARAGGTWNS